jgi:hypothetical protein
VGAWSFGLQVPMVGQGVVEALVATLDVVQREGVHALPVQEAACKTLWNLAEAAENRVRWCNCGLCAGDVWSEEQEESRVVLCLVSSFTLAACVPWLGACVDVWIYEHDVHA